MTDAHTAEQKLAGLMGGRGFSSAMPAAVTPPMIIPALRDGDLHIGDTAAKIPVGISLSRLIDGRLLIQGNSGAGKSMLLRRLFEQAFGKVQLLLIDADGEFSTLAEHFDVAVLPAVEVLRIGGKALANHLREHRYSCIVDLSDANDEDRLLVAAEIAEGLVEAPSEFWHPLLVLIDEAQAIVPHYDTGSVEAVTRKRAISALADLMGRGRKRGIAGVIATQRLAETSKAVCSKATNIIVGRTIFDRDLERAGGLLGFTVGQSRPLRNLLDGEFICMGPAIAGTKRVRFRAGAVVSRHKGAAPEMAPPPAVSAEQSLALLKQVPAAPREHGAGFAHRPGKGRRGRDWRPEEDAIIRAGYAVGKPIAEIGAQLAAIGFSTSTSNISMRAHALGLVSAKKAVAWSEREDEILRDAYAGEVRIMDIVDLLAKEGFTRSRVAIQMRAIGLGITRDRVNYWKEPEKQITIAGLESGKPYREIIEDLREAGYHRGLTGILKFAQKNNFNRAGERWTAEQIAQLKKFYAKRLPVREIAEKLGKPIQSVRTRASNLGLKQRTPWTEAEREILLKAERKGTPLTAAAQDIGRPFPNVYAEARRMGLDLKKFGRTKAERRRKTNFNPNTKENRNADHSRARPALDRRKGQRQKKRARR